MSGMKGLAIVIGAMLAFMAAIAVLATVLAP
ncbi:hypothetical protein HNR12_003149 [Streptomonospora nanhaiensis]|uniref:Uncharacterized protein n=1 Tax=Streptomonospora nanhaiensis TaxID=1323731 RepID=A0A853BR87_9ACTN|nr:hypothetical protein [Streptomonospora nanhaiensis]